MSRVYLATCWVNKVEALAAQEKFEAAGFKVVSHWIKHHQDAADKAGETRTTVNLLDYDFGELQDQAAEDIRDIINADYFVILNLGLSEGKAFEMGFAYALTIPIILVGERTNNIFYYLNSVTQVGSVEHAISHIQVRENV